GAALNPSEVQSLDLESRALVLMRAEKAQLAWESKEVDRRGHALTERIKATSYNVAPAVRQAQLSASLSWDSVAATTESGEQSNAF
ncbi:hypothetical protein NL374_27500, partial [Klebsiella pneumoniae]|nr:hypothetical protein [Klebsiella pneumoniae]